MRHANWLVSCLAVHFWFSKKSVCATPAAAFVDECYERMLTSLHRPGGAVAQLGARLDGIEEVVGSNPIGSTKFHFCRFSGRLPSQNLN
jgi:hypothetical protein